MKISTIFPRLSTAFTRLLLGRETAAEIRSDLGLSALPTDIPAEADILVGGDDGKLHLVGLSGDASIDKAGKVTLADSDTARANLDVYSIDEVDEGFTEAGAVIYKGAWDPSTNTPILDDGTSGIAPEAAKGHYYIATGKGKQFDEMFKAGDWIVSNGITWDKVGSSGGAGDFAPVYVDDAYTTVDPQEMLIVDATTAPFTITVGEDTTGLIIIDAEGLFNTNEVTIDFGNKKFMGQANEPLELDRESTLKLDYVDDTYGFTISSFSPVNLINEELTLISQQEAEDGTDTNVVGWSAERVHQAAKAAVENYLNDDSVSILKYDYDSKDYDTSRVKMTSVHKAMRRCVVNDQGGVNYYLDANDSTKKEDGTAANLDGSDGQVMVEIPVFYCSVSTIKRILTLILSPYPAIGLQRHPAFFNGGNPVDKIYVGAYNATVINSNGATIAGLNLDNNTARVNLSSNKLCSLSGGNHYPMVGLNLSEFRQLAKNRGEGWQQLDFLTWQAIQFLAYTQLGTFNGQAALGSGRVDKSYVASSSNQADSPHTLNGLSNGNGNQSTANSEYVTFNGIEHIWGNCYQWADGMLYNDTQTYICNDASKFADTITEDYIAVGSPMNSIGATSTWLYYKEFQNIINPLLLPSVGGGNSGDFTGDGYYYAMGLRAALVGLNAGQGVRAGFAALLGNSAPSYRNRDVGGRIMLKPKVGG